MALEVFSKRKRRIGEWLIAEKIINQDQLDRALEVKQHSEKKLGEIIVDLGFCPEDFCCKILSRSFLLGRRPNNSLKNTVTRNEFTFLGRCPKNSAKKFHNQKG